MTSMDIVSMTSWLSVTSGLVAITASILALYVIVMSRQHRVFKRLNIPGPDPWPAVGNFPEVAKLGVFAFQRKYYDKYAGHKVYGFFDPGCPLMVVRDLDLLRDVTIKHFHKFVNRRPFLTNEKPFDKILTVLKDDRWRNVRQILSTTFSTGKLRRMFVHVEVCAKALKAHALQCCRSGDDLELKDTMSCYTMDVIASAGFGVGIDSLNDRSSPFFVAGKKIISFSGKMASFVILFPPLVKLLIALGWTAFDKDSTQFFTSFVDRAVEERKREDRDGAGGDSSGSGGGEGEGHQRQPQHNRHDLLQILINAERTDSGQGGVVNNVGRGSSDQRTLSREDIKAQAVIFMLASFDTVATVLSFGLFAIANNPHICARIQQELDDVLGEGSPTYDNVQSLLYLDQCVNEALRMFTPVIFVDRVCTEDCVIGDVHIPKGMVVVLPVFAIHRDKNHWPNPDTFDPDRFKADVKETRHPFAHMAFGHGPRNCLGMRLARLKIKMALASILQTMTPVPCGKTVYPPRLSKYQMRAEDNLWVKMIVRKT